MSGVRVHQTDQTPITLPKPMQRARWHLRHLRLLFRLHTANSGSVRCWPLRTFPLTCSHFSTCLFLLQEPFFLAKFLDFPVERSKVNNLLFVLLCGLTRRAEPMRDGPVLGSRLVPQHLGRRLGWAPLGYMVRRSAVGPSVPAPTLHVGLALQPSASVALSSVVG